MPFYDPSNWKLVQEIQSYKQEILNEFKFCVDNKLIQIKANPTTSLNQSLYRNIIGFLPVVMELDLWAPEEKKFFTESFLAGSEVIRKHCPVASMIIKKYPAIRQFYWNILPGHGEINPHYGVNGKIWDKIPDHTRIQFCWEPGEQCFFYLENEYIEYKENLCFGFRDGMDLHWVKNFSDKPRSVLILDLWEKDCEEIKYGTVDSIKGNFSF
jgi:hypothetical protein